MGDLRDCDPGMNGFGCNDAVVALRQLCGIAGRVEVRGKVRRARKSQTVLPDRVGVFFPDVVGPHLGFAGFREVRGEQTSYSSATDHTDLHCELRTFRLTAVS